MSTISRTWVLSVVVIVVDRVPSLAGVIIPVQVTVRPPQVDQILKQTHTGERTIRSTGRFLCLVRGIEVLHRRGWPFSQLLVRFAKVYQILKKISHTHISHILTSAVALLMDEIFHYSFLKSFKNWFFINGIC